MGDFNGLFVATQRHFNNEARKIQDKLEETQRGIGKWLLEAAASQKRQRRIEDAEGRPPPSRQPQPPIQPQTVVPETPPQAASYRGQPLQPAEQLRRQRADPSKGFDFAKKRKQDLVQWHEGSATREAIHERAKEAEREKEERRHAQALARQEEKRQAAAIAELERKEAAAAEKEREKAQRERDRLPAMREQMAREARDREARERDREARASGRTTRYADHIEKKIEEEMRRLEQKDQKAKEAAAARSAKATADKMYEALRRVREREAERGAGDTYAAQKIAAQRHQENKEAAARARALKRKNTF
jgi:hypothetical protein